jgi:ABC-type transport system involved in multi-copper enzyme maturation permease subunit
MTGKVLALGVALFSVLALPQIVLVIGNAVASDDLLDSLQNQSNDYAPIIVSSLLVAGFMTSMSMAIASQSSRRAIATGAVLAYFVIFAALGGILVETTDGDAGQLLVLISPFDLLEGAVLWIFNAPPESDSTVANAGLAGGWHGLAAVIYTAGALAYLYWRYARASV